MTPEDLGLAGVALRPTVVTIDVHRRHLDPDRRRDMFAPHDDANAVASSTETVRDGREIRQSGEMRVIRERGDVVHIT